jgi:hypothetical protein
MQVNYYTENKHIWSSGCRLDARMTTLFCKKITVVKSKEAKTGWSEVQICQNLLRKAMAEKGLFCQWWR